MSDLELATLPKPKALPEPLMVAPPGAVRCAIFYNPFDPSNRTIRDLEWAPDKPLSAYLDGLPEHVEWNVTLNCREQPKSGWMLTIPREGDMIAIHPVVQGGKGSGKQIIMLVAALALAVVSAGIASGAILGGMAGAIAGSIGVSAASVSAVMGAVVTVVGGVLINMLAPKPNQPSAAGSQNEEDGLSFGLDGPKNVSTEGIPVPIVYGKRQVGGNFVQLFTENATGRDGVSTQFVTGQLAISEGPIKSITNIEINDQPASTFDLVEFDYGWGTQNQSPGEWFDQVVELIQIGRDVTTNWDTYTTSKVVDALRFDVVAPEGVMTIDASSGKRNEHRIGFELQYRPAGSTAAWRNFGGMAFVDNASLSQFDAPATGFRAYVEMAAKVTTRTMISAALDYRLVGTSTWIELLDQSISIDRHVNGKGQTVSSYATMTFAMTDLPAGIYEVRARNTSNPAVNVTIQPRVINLDRYMEAPVKIVDRTRSVVRRTFTTPRLPQDHYEIRWRRTAVEDSSDYVLDKLIANEVGEILFDEVGLVNTAWLGFRVLLSGQLSNLPKVTALVEGRILPIYDDEGNQIDEVYSDNPADIVLDAYLNTRYGGQIAPNLIDFPAFAEWREFCVENDLHANMVFDYQTNIEEAMNVIYAAGRAKRISSGARISVAIDRPDAPSMMFGAGNIVRDTMRITYMPFEDRVNEIEMVFPDKNDGYKSRSIRLSDDVAIARGEVVRPTTINAPALVDIEKVWSEGWRALMHNRFVSRTVTFEAPLEAIACLPGDVIAVQHEMPDWETGGRVAPGSTAGVVVLDREVHMELGKTYKLLVLHSALKRYDVSVSSQIGRKVYVTGVPQAYTTMRRFVHANGDFGIERLTWGATLTEILLDERSNGVDLTGVAELWDTDVVEERQVSVPAAQVDPIAAYTTVVVDEPFTVAPEPQVNFMFGEILEVGRLFRVVAITAGSELNQRTITAMEYRDEVYNTAPPVLEGLGAGGAVQTGHVENLIVREEIDLTIDLRRSKVQLDWTRPSTSSYGGAVIETRVNGGNWTTVATVRDATVFEFEGNVGDLIDVRVVAFSLSGAEASRVTAPQVSILLVGHVNAPAPPTGFQVTPMLNGVSIVLDEHPAPDFSRFRLYMRTNTGINPLDPEVSFLKAITGTQTTQTGLDPATVYYFWAAAQDSSGNVSALVGPISAQPASSAPDDDASQTYIGENNVASNGTVLSILSYTASSASSSTQVSLTSTGNARVRVYRAGGENDTLTGQDMRVELRRRPTAGGTAVVLRSAVNPRWSGEGSWSFNWGWSFAVTDTPGAGNWTYELVAFALGTTFPPKPTSPENAVADVFNAALDVTRYN